jgi:P-type Ca2+ transporter type 2C
MGNPDVEAKLQEYNTDPKQGLTTAQVEANRKKFGSNILTPPEKAPLWKLYLEKFEDPTIIILSGAAGLAFLSGLYRGLKFDEWLGILEAVAILIAVAIATGVGFFLEYKADQAFELLKEEADNLEVKITRDGAFHTITVNDLVTGDIVHLESGDKIPADGLVIESTDLQVDQSVYTGESVAVYKDEMADPNLIGFTDIVEGMALMLVTQVGDNSERGEIAKKLGEQEKERTPLEHRLDIVADLINVAGTGAASLIFMAMFGDGLVSGGEGVLGEFGTEIAQTGQLFFLGLAGLTIFATVIYSFSQRGKETLVRNILLGALAVFIVGIVAIFGWGDPLGGDPLATGVSSFDNLLIYLVDPLLAYFMLAVTIVVVAVPEGLPMAITISLALSMRKIRQDNNLVRKMVATETLGSTNIICSDKTGTLTLNQMAVDEVFVHNQVHESKDGNGEAVNLVKHPAFERMALISARNSTGELEQKLDQLKFVGNPTECALLKWLKDQEVAYGDYREKVPIEHLIPFTASRKMMSTIVQENGQTLLLSKGAPERILARCKEIEIGAGQIEAIDQHIDNLNAQIDAMTEKAMRPLALAYRTIPADADPKAADVETDMTFLALFGVSDPVRPDVPAAVALCKEAFVKIKMVTGDHKKTAAVIADRIGLLEEDSLVVTGEEFKAMSDEEIMEKADRLHVLARFNPLDKERLVRLLQADKESVVAVTGDGTNDAPALKRADVGIAMGKRGTDIAKEASDIILVDDNFVSIVRAIHWGRTLYENVQKFLQFQLTINFSALAVAFLSPLFAIGLRLLADADINLLPNSDFQELPLTILQLLWINLIMDTLAALALSLEPPRDDVMKEPPKKRTDSFITRDMLESVLVMGSYFTVIVLAMQAFGSYLGVKPTADNAKQISSIIFATYVFLQVFNLFNARSVLPERSAFAGIAQSRNFWLILISIVVVQIGLIQFGGNAFNTAPLELGMWVKIILLGASALVVGEGYRFIRRRKAQS